MYRNGRHIWIRTGKNTRVRRRVSEFALSQDRSAMRPDNKSAAYAGVEARKEAREDELEQAREHTER